MIHFGVYALAFEKSKILVVRKNTGPYKNRYDLPGGSKKNDYESLIDALAREITEETGARILSIDNNYSFDFYIKVSEDFDFQHIAIFYLTKLKIDTTHRINDWDDTGNKNDASEFLWLDIAAINLSNASPLLLKAKEIALGNITFATEYYHSWQVID